MDGAQEERSGVELDMGAYDAGLGRHSNGPGRPWKTENEEPARPKGGDNLVSLLTNRSHPVPNSTAGAAPNPSGGSRGNPLRSTEEAQVSSIPEDPLQSLREDLDLDLVERLEHLWRRSCTVGACEAVQVPASEIRSNGPVPLCGSGSNQWSTLGGDTRSFVQVVQSNTRRMAGRGGVGDFRGAGRAGRGGRDERWDEQQDHGNRFMHRNWADHRRGQFQPSQWRYREVRQNLPHQNRGHSSTSGTILIREESKVIG